MDLILVNLIDGLVTGLLLFMLSAGSDPYFLDDGCT